MFFTVYWDFPVAECVGAVAQPASDESACFSTAKAIEAH